MHNGPAYPRIPSERVIYAGGTVGDDGMCYLGRDPNELKNAAPGEPRPVTRL